MMVRRDGPWGRVVPVVAGTVAGAGVLAGASPAAGAWLPAAGAGLVAGVLVGVGLPVVVAWYWSIHCWRAG